MTTNDGRPQPPEGKLIQARREALDMKASVCGRMAGMNENEWRWYERGWRPKGRDHYVQVRIRTEPLVRMALIVGLTALDLYAVRRLDAVVELARRQGEDGPTTVARMLLGIKQLFGEATFEAGLDIMDELPPTGSSTVYQFPSGAQIAR